jgi:uncharacterized membrane protein HdeD (DUF308 family)
MICALRYGVCISKEELAMSTTTFAPSALFKKSFGWVIAFSVVMIIAGSLAVIMPPVAGIAVTILFGWLLTVSGVAHLGYAWQTRGTGAILWEILLAAAYLFAGIYTLVHPLLSLVSLTLILGVYLFVEAILEFIMAVRLRPVAGSGWLFVDGIVTLVLAIMIWRSWPSSSAWALGLLVGFSMLFSGMSRLMISLAARRVVNQIA